MLRAVDRAAGHHSHRDACSLAAVTLRGRRWHAQSVEDGGRIRRMKLLYGLVLT